MSFSPCCHNWLAYDTNSSFLHFCRMLANSYCHNVLKSECLPTRFITWKVSRHGVFYQRKLGTDDFLSTSILTDINFSGSFRTATLSIYFHIWSWESWITWWSFFHISHFHQAFLMALKSSFLPILESYYKETTWWVYIFCNFLEFPEKIISRTFVNNCFWAF